MPSWSPPSPGGSGGAARGGGSRGGGIPIDFRRGKTAKKVLEIAWIHPVWKPPAAATGGGRTAAPQVERALPIAEAWRQIADGDRRPLLVLRECERCKGTDHALLDRSLDSEQTVLLTHWFRCVKLPPNVLDSSHPFHNLFRREQEGDRIPHLFFAHHDGSHRKDLPGDQPQTVLWETMFAYLERCYTGSARQALKDLRQLLSKYDKLDAEEQLVKARLDKEIEKHGPDSAGARRFEADLRKLAKERDKLLAWEKELRSLALKSQETEEAAAPPPAAGPPAEEPGAGK